MKVKITEPVKLSGKYVCTFTDDDQEYVLRYDLENWVNIKESGLFGGNYIQILLPEQMNLVLDHEYEIETKIARKVYDTLAKHGWTP
jgi:hypothetical protein